MYVVVTASYFGSSGYASASARITGHPVRAAFAAAV